VDLSPLRFMFELRISRCEEGFKDGLTMTSPHEKERRRHRLEGSLSDAWQAYCSFVRQLLIRSATGCLTAQGFAHPASVFPANWQRVSYVAMRANQGAEVRPHGLNNLLRKEPTWGDVGHIVAIVTALNPGNSGNLIGNLAGGLSGPKHCQTVRNACAHSNHQTRAEVESLASSYIASRVKHPTDAMIWRDPSTMQFAFLSWLDDMRTIATGAVK
jgi:hypothetical protein